MNWLLYYPIERLLARCTDCLVTINKEDIARARRFRAGRLKSHGGSEGDGKLYGLVKKDLPARASVAHVRDNGHSDVKMAAENGFTAVHYPNVNRMALTLRAYDMSPVVGGAYRGIVDTHLYQGGKVYSSEYEYGYVYGGLFVLGYCDFIHAYCESHGVDRILFLSRDGDILKQVYDRMYPGSPASYVYWSRAASTKLMAEYDRYDFFRRYLYHKVNQGILVREILETLDLGEILEGLLAGLPPGLLDEVLTDRNVETLKKYFQDNWQEICAVYGEYREATKLYFQRELEGARRVVAVDIGWAGSGAMALSYLAEQVWRFPCKVTGLMAGTNTVHNAEPDASEIFLQNGKLVSYLFSQTHNRDVMKRHDPGKDYNVFWKLLLSSPTRQFSGFCFGETVRKEVSVDRRKEGLEHIPESGSTETGILKSRLPKRDTVVVRTGICNGGREVCLKFGRKDVNPEGMQEIQRGIMDFVTDYKMHFDLVPYMFHISGRDACAPMLLAASYREQYLKIMAERFALEKGVG